MFVQVSALNAELPHQPLHPFAAHPDGSRANMAWMRGAPYVRRDRSQMASTRSATGASATARRRVSGRRGRRRWTPVRRSRRAAAQPRRCHDAFPRTSRPAPGRVGLLGEKRARQRRGSRWCASARRSPCGAVSAPRRPCWSTGHPARHGRLVLTDPLAECFGTDPQLPCHIGDRAAF